MGIRRRLARLVTLVALTAGAVGLLGGVAHAEPHTDCGREQKQARLAHERVAAMNRFEVYVTAAGIPISAGLEQQVKDATRIAAMADLAVDLCTSV
jgi:hypothetical protein